MEGAAAVAVAGEGWGTQEGRTRLHLQAGAMIWPVAQGSWAVEG